MNKKILSILIAILIVVRISVFNVSAAFVGFAAEALVELYYALLVGSGAYTASEVQGLSLDEMESIAQLGINTKLINPCYAYEAIFDFLNSDVGVAAQLGIRSVEDAYVDWLCGLTASDLILTSLADLKGGACLAMVPDNFGRYEVYYGGTSGIVTGESFIIPNVIYWETQNSKGEVVWTSTGLGTVDNPIIDFKASRTGAILIGNWQYVDGTPFDTGEETVPYIGEADGTQVTIDMLNPDGTVTIDDVDVPVTIDPDKISDTSLIDLINKILDIISDTPVVVPDTITQDIVDSVDIPIPGNLSDYVVPKTIANIFPFCIPFDIVRGFQILNCPAVAPKFEIPFNIPEFGLFPGFEDSIILDFSKYYNYIQIFRWFQIIFFSFLLCKLSITYVKGAGA